MCESRANSIELNNRQPNNALFVCSSSYTGKKRCPHQYPVHPLATSSLLTFFVCLFIFHFSFLAVLHLFVFLTWSVHSIDSAGTKTRSCTDASVQVSPSWQPQLPWQECAYSLAPLCQEWMSKSGPQKQLFREWSKERDFFDYHPFVHLPLKLFHSLRPLSKWAMSQVDSQG